MDGDTNHDYTNDGDADDVGDEYDTNIIAITIVELVDDNGRSLSHVIYFPFLISMSYSVFWIGVLETDEK